MPPRDPRGFFRGQRALTRDAVQESYRDFDAPGRSMRGRERRGNQGRLAPPRAAHHVDVEGVDVGRHRTRLE